MARVRKLFLLVAVALLVLIGLLSERAITSVAAERQAHHTLVAERIFDEMERELSTFLEREEERPFGHYRHDFVAAQLTNAAALGKLPLSRSPLAELPVEPYLVGYFELDPNGVFNTPLRPRDRAHWRPSPEVSQRVDQLQRLVLQRWPQAGAKAGPRQSQSRGAGMGKEQQAKTPGGRIKQLPGTTVIVPDGPDPAPAVAVAAQADVQPEQQPVEQEKSSLRALNRGVSKRSKRSAKVTSTSASNVGDFERGESEPGGRGTLLDFFERPQRSGPPSDARNEPLDDGLSGGSTAFQQRDGRAALIDLGLEPMVGVLVDPDHLILYRTVWLGNRAFRQGLVIDVEQLAIWLYDSTVGGSPLAAHTRVAISGAPAIEASAGYRYSHRFGDPFADLSAVSSLAPLPDAVSPTYVYALVAALLLAGVLGLIALYRMVSVMVAYAQRRSDFVSAVTHELKTPLTSIRMYGEMLQEEMVPNDEKRHEYYRHITAETERLSRLINNVLELARLEKGRREMTLVAESPRAVIEQVLEVLTPQAQSEGFRLTLDVEPDLPPVRFDRDALLQVLFNLVDNALKYARKAEHKEIVISCQRTPDGAGVSLGVRDHGPGVSERHLRRIFEPFYRGQNELTRTAKGTGIGLALVAGLVERMHGEVSGRNLDDGGFEVRVALPAAS